MAETKNTKTFYNTKIPGDWEVKELGKIGELKNGINKEKEDFGFGFPMVNLMDVFGISRVYKNNFQLGLVNATERDIKEYSLQKGDVLFIRSSVKPEGVGLTTVICDDLENTTYSGFIIRFRDNGCLDLEYKAHCFFEVGFRRRLLNKSTISANTNINQGALNSLKIPLPPLPEQKAIAQVLSTADAAIRTTEKLIAQKELRKKWLMQQLLTGKKRLPAFANASAGKKGFGGEWKEMKLKDVTTNFSRRNKKLVDAKVYSVTNKRGFVLQSDHFEGKVAGEDLSNYKIIKKNEFAYNPARVNVGSLAYFEEEIGVISSLYVCFKTTKDVLDYFLLQFLQIDHTKHRIEALGEGGVRVYLWYDLFSKIKIKLPSIEEQTAIAQVLQAADKEISLLKAKAEKVREQKKGLMQVLLTGKVRLKIN